MNLRTKPKVNYKLLSDVDPSILSSLNLRCSWDPKLPYPIEILNEVNDTEVTVQYVGAGNTWIKRIKKADIVMVEKASEPCGPKTQNDFYEVLAFKIFKALREPPNHIDPVREIRIETNLETADLIIEDLEDRKHANQLVHVTKLQNLLGDNFDTRQHSKEGNHCFIRSGTIRYRRATPPPEIYYKKVNNVPIQHHAQCNPALCFTFVCKYKIIDEDDEVEY